MDLVAELMGDGPEYMTRTLEDLELANLRFPLLERSSDGAIRPPETFRPLGLVAYANHDNAPLASLYTQFKTKADQDPDSTPAKYLQALLNFASFTNHRPDELDSELLKSLQCTLFATSSRLAVLMCSDLLGIPLRFNLPGSYGKDTWADRLELPWPTFETIRCSARELPPCPP